MLYDYLKELGGICASHTSATGHGDRLARQQPEVRADRRDLPGAPQLLRAPRGARGCHGGRARRSAAGSRWAWSGTPWRCSTSSASRPRATTSRPTSATPSRSPRTRRGAAILDAFKQRHCYAATDNILLDVRSGEHLMGDEFDADGPVRLKVLVHGTRPIAQIDIIKDFVYVYSTEPNGPARRVRVDRRGEGPPGRPELVLRPRHPGRRRARLGEPVLGPPALHPRSGGINRPDGTLAEFSESRLLSPESSVTICSVTSLSGGW